MTIYSFHLAQVSVRAAVKALATAPAAPGLEHVEVLAGMRLGAAVVSPARMQLRRIAVFAQWRDEAALESFLARDGFGRELAEGWHVRLEYVRQWGHLSELDELPEAARAMGPDEPVVAVTVARMRLPELARFIHWGRPVERQIRDHPESTLATAAIRWPRTVSTFSVWTSTRAMTRMVFGKDAGEPARRHNSAMAERERRDFHHEFTTLRFRPLAEHGSWQGRSDYIPWTGTD